LFSQAASGGARAVGQKTGAIAAGHWCDIVSLDPDHPVLCARSGDDWLNGWLFSGDRGCVRDVWVSGRHIVQNGRHADHDQSATRFRAAMEDLID
jgi:formimidoylglutamate deiminase